MISRNFHSSLLLSDVLTASNAPLKVVVIFVFSMNELSAASERTDYVGKAPTIAGHYFLKATTSVEACYNDAAKEVKVPFLTVFSNSNRKGSCNVLKLTGPWYFKLVVLKETGGILKDQKEHTTSVKKMDPALVLYWILDKVSKNLLGSLFSSL